MMYIWNVFSNVPNTKNIILTKKFMVVRQIGVPALDDLALVAGHQSTVSGSIPRSSQSLIQE